MAVGSFELSLVCFYGCCVVVVSRCVGVFVLLDFDWRIFLGSRISKIQNCPQGPAKLALSILNRHGLYFLFPKARLC